jgi:FlaA1/EpsC-like NDP-sugar epimerase
MKSDFNDDRLRFIMGDVVDNRQVNKAMQGVDICVHAAAAKRIDSCELNPIEAVRVNVQGTINIVDSALYNQIECLLYISTDKAKSPETTYGATKFVSEQIIRNAYHLKGSNPTKFKTVRYGNVIGSTGSVLTIWEEQHDKGLPITVRDKEMTRFFMTVQQASQLILDTIQTGEENTEHSLPMKSVNIYELAKYLYPDDEIVITGLENCEKIHEDLYEGYNSKDHTVKPEDIL